MWSKTKRALKSLWCESLVDRVVIHVTTYPTGVDCGRAWITVDGEQWLEVRDCDRCAAHMKAMREGRDLGPECDDHLGVGDVLSSIKRYLEAPFDESLASDEGLTQVLAALDRRLGKRRLREIDWRSVHERAEPFFRLRCKVEGVRVAQDEAS